MRNEWACISQKIDAFKDVFFPLKTTRCHFNSACFLKHGQSMRTWLHSTHTPSYSFYPFHNFFLPQLFLMPFFATLSPVFFFLPLTGNHTLPSRSCFRSLSSDSNSMTVTRLSSLVTPQPNTCTSYIVVCLGEPQHGTHVAHWKWYAFHVTKNMHWCLSRKGPTIKVRVMSKHSYTMWMLPGPELPRDAA